MPITVTYTPEQLRALLQLLDMAVKAGGLAVVGNAAVLQNKYAEALQAAQAKAEAQLNTNNEG